MGYIVQIPKRLQDPPPRRLRTDEGSEQPISMSIVGRLAEQHVLLREVVVSHGSTTVAADDDIERPTTGATSSDADAEYAAANAEIAKFLAEDRPSSEETEAFFRGLKLRMRRSLASKRGTAREVCAGRWYTRARQKLNTELAAWGQRGNVAVQRPQLKGWIVEVRMSRDVSNARRVTGKITF